MELHFAVPDTIELWKGFLQIYVPKMESYYITCAMNASPVHQRHLHKWDSAQNIQSSVERRAHLRDWAVYNFLETGSLVIKTLKFYTILKMNFCIQMFKEQMLDS
jgi:hypothetical protein